MACLLARSAPGQSHVVEHGGRERMAPVMDAACRLCWLDPTLEPAGRSNCGRRGKQTEHFPDPVGGLFVVIDIALQPFLPPFGAKLGQTRIEIGRGSCRERVCQYV